jgi:hypothetical protein
VSAVLARTERVAGAAGFVAGGHGRAGVVVGGGADEDLSRVRGNGS